MPNELLPQSEKPMLLFRVRRSKWFIIWPLIFLGIALFALAGVLFSVSGDNAVGLDIQALGGLVLLFGFVIGALIIIIDWMTTYYILTDQTVEIVKDFFTFHKTYLSLHDLSKAEVKSGMIGHFFDYGSIILESETSEKPILMVGVPSPHQVIDLIRQARAHVANSDQ